jgi:hypothetical protein
MAGAATDSQGHYFRNAHNAFVQMSDWKRGYHYQLAALKRSIYSLGDLRELLAAATRRYLEFGGNWRIIVLGGWP